MTVNQKTILVPTKGPISLAIVENTCRQGENQHLLVTQGEKLILVMRKQINALYSIQAVENISQHSNRNVQLLASKINYIINLQILPEFITTFQEVFNMDAKTIDLVMQEDEHAMEILKAI